MAMAATTAPATAQGVQPSCSSSAEPPTTLPHRPPPPTTHRGTLYVTGGCPPLSPHSSQPVLLPPTPPPGPASHARAVVPRVTTVPTSAGALAPTMPLLWSSPTESPLPLPPPALAPTISTTTYPCAGNTVGGGSLSTAACPPSDAADTSGSAAPAGGSSSGAPVAIPSSPQTVAGPLDLCLAFSHPTGGRAAPVTAVAPCAAPDPAVTADPTDDAVEPPRADPPPPAPRRAQQPLPPEQPPSASPSLLSVGRSQAGTPSPGAIWILHRGRPPPSPRRTIRRSPAAGAGGALLLPRCHPSLPLLLPLPLSSLPERPGRGADKRSRRATTAANAAPSAAAWRVRVERLSFAIVPAAAAAAVAATSSVAEEAPPPPPELLCRRGRRERVAAKGGGVRAGRLQGEEGGDAPRSLAETGTAGPATLLPLPPPVVCAKCAPSLDAGAGGGGAAVPAREAQPLHRP